MDSPTTTEPTNSTSINLQEPKSLKLDIPSFRVNNPKMEQMRSTLKNTLFQSHRGQSLTAFPLSHNQDATEEIITPTSDSSATSRNGGSGYGNPKLQKYRQMMKSSLFSQPIITSIGSIDKGLNDLAEEGHLGEKVGRSTTSIVLTPTNVGGDDSYHEGHGGFAEASNRSLRSHGIKTETNLTTGETSLNGIQSLECIESPARHPDKRRSSIFMRDIESEIEEIKRDLNVENDPNIHFIRGNFYTIYEEGKILGEGSTGIVKKCTKFDTNMDYAVKVVNYRDDLEILTLIVKEFKNHRRLHHKNIIKVYDLYIDYFTKKIYTVMELSECKEMFDVLKNLGHYSEAVASGIFKQILTGINYLHLNGVCHRDLKPNNLLVSDDGKIVKITDFNVSKFVENKMKKYSSLSKANYKMWTYTGTIAFTAPEVFAESEYSEAVDMWSAGVVLYTMLCGYQPFHAEYVNDLIELIKSGKYEFPSDPWDNISKQAKNLVKRCLDINPKTRCSPSEALIYPWIANCGKVPNTNIPRTVYYFNRFWRRNTGIRGKFREGNRRSSKKSSFKLGANKLNGEDPISKRSSLEWHEITSDFLDETPQAESPKDSHLHVDSLQPKRGKTGPEAFEPFGACFHLGNPLKLEKSHSLSLNPENDNNENGDDELNDDDGDDDEFNLPKVGITEHKFNQIKSPPIRHRVLIERALKENKNHIGPLPRVLARKKIVNNVNIGDENLIQPDKGKQIDENRKVRLENRVLEPLQDQNTN